MVVIMSFDIEKLKDLLKAVFDLIDPKRRMSKDSLDLWYLCLKKYDFKEVQGAFSKYIQQPGKGQYVPKPADIIEILSGSYESNAMQAWSKVERSICQVGAYSDVCFDDPLINRTIQDMGGWIKLCQTDEKELKFRAIEFRNRYQSYRGSSKMPAYPKLLYGIATSENSGKELEYKENPIFVGNKEKAAITYQGGKKMNSLEISEGFAGIKLPQIG